MRPIAPRLGWEERTIAEEQPEYLPLTIAIRGPTEGGSLELWTRYTFTAEERARIGAGEDVYIGQLYVGRGFTPQMAQVGPTGLHKPEDGT